LTITWPAESRKGLTSMRLSILRIAESAPGKAPSLQELLDQFRNPSRTAAARAWQRRGSPNPRVDAMMQAAQGGSSAFKLLRAKLIVCDRDSNWFRHRFVLPFAVISYPVPPCFRLSGRARLRVRSPAPGGRRRTVTIGELLARVKAQLRRVHHDHTSHTVRAAGSSSPVSPPRAPRPRLRRAW